MKVEEPDLAGTYSYADYFNWTWPERAELIMGKIFKMSPAPSRSHQNVLLRLSLQIGNFLRRKQCQLFIAPFDVRLPLSPAKERDEDIKTVVQPDLCVVCDPTKIDERGCLGAPDWIIEILSPHTSSKDLREKFEVYEQSGVREYWVVHPVEQTVLVYVLNPEGVYEGVLKPYVREDKISPITLPDLTIDLEEVFQND